MSKIAILSIGFITWPRVSLGIYFIISAATRPGQASPNQHQHYNNIIIRLCNIIIGTGELQEGVEVVNLVVHSPTQPPKRTTTQLADKVCLKLLAPNNNVIK